MREVELSSEVENVTDELKEENSAPEKQKEMKEKEEEEEGKKEEKVESMESEKEEERNLEDGKPDAVEVRWNELLFETKCVKTSE